MRLYGSRLLQLRQAPGIFSLFPAIRIAGTTMRGGAAKTVNIRNAMATVFAIITTSGGSTPGAPKQRHVKQARVPADF